jgi:hypothetical protein
MSRPMSRPMSRTMSRPMSRPNKSVVDDARDRAGETVIVVAIVKHREAATRRIGPDHVALEATVTAMMIPVTTQRDDVAASRLGLKPSKFWSMRTSRITRNPKAAAEGEAGGDDNRSAAGGAGRTGFPIVGRPLRFMSAHKIHLFGESRGGRQSNCCFSCPMVAILATVSREPGQALTGAAISGVALCGGRRHRARENLLLSESSATSHA